MNDSDIKRNTVFIQKKFQLRSIMTVVSIIAAAGLLSGVLLYFMLSSELSSELKVAHQQIQNTWDSLAPAIVFGNILTVLVTSIVAAIAVLYQSHKIAGPMFRLQTMCEEVSNGNYSPVTSLRKADQLTALAQSFATMIAALREKQTRKESVVEDIKGSLEALMGQLEDEAHKKTVNDMLDKINNL